MITEMPPSRVMIVLPSTDGGCVKNHIPCNRHRTEQSQVPDIMHIIGSQMGISNKAEQAFISDIYMTFLLSSLHIPYYYLTAKVISHSSSSRVRDGRRNHSQYSNGPVTIPASRQWCRLHAETVTDPPRGKPSSAALSRVIYLSGFMGPVSCNKTQSCLEDDVIVDCFGFISMM